MAKEDEIKEVHRSIAPDLDLANVAIQYQDLQDCAEMQKADPFSMLQNMLQGAKDEYPDVCDVLGRILACKPHSAGCQRVILFIIRSNQHADHLSSAKPSAITFTYI